MGAALLDRPRDPQGPPEETYNCRCQMDVVRLSELTPEQRAKLDQAGTASECAKITSDYLNRLDMRKTWKDYLGVLNSELQVMTERSSSPIVDFLEHLIDVVAEFIAELASPDPRDTVDPEWSKHSSNRATKIGRSLSRAIAGVGILFDALDYYEGHELERRTVVQIISRMDYTVENIRRLDIGLADLALSRQELGCPPIPREDLNNR